MIPIVDNQEVFERVLSLIKSYRVLLDENQQDIILRGGKILRAWREKLQKLVDENKKTGFLFNPLLLMGIGEAKHSELLGYLLKPQESHGHGNLFLISFIKKLGVSDPEKGHWVVTVERERIDIMLRRSDPPSVIIIENKSNYAVDQPNQIYRYWDKLINKPHGHRLGKYDDPEVLKNFRVIYMPPDQSKSPEEHTLTCPEHLRNENMPARVPQQMMDTLTFNHDVAEWIGEVIDQVAPTNVRLRTYLKFYKELCEQL
ncbi:MAG: PD-(D/E)XK nuclease family protein [Bacteroidota bacterium]